MVPIRLMGMIYIPLIIFFLIPSSAIGIVIKIILAIWIVVTIVSSFSNTWVDYENLGAFIVLNTLWFILFLWLNNPFWLRYIFGFLIVTGFGTLFKQIDAKNNQK